MQTFRNIVSPERTTTEPSENPEFILPHDPPERTTTEPQVDLNNNAINENPKFILPHDPPIYIPNWPSLSQVDLNNNVINSEFIVGHNTPSEPINIINIPNSPPTPQYILPHNPPNSPLPIQSPIHPLSSALDEKNNDLSAGQLYGQWNQVALNHARYYLRKKYLHLSDNM